MHLKQQQRLPAENQQKYLLNSAFGFKKLEKYFAKITTEIS